MNCRFCSPVIVVVMTAALSGCTTVYQYPKTGPPQQTVVRVENANASAFGADVQYPTGRQSTAYPAKPIKAPPELLNEIVLAYKRDAYHTVIRLSEEVLSYASATPDQRAQALVYAGAICFVHGDNSSAQRHFQQAVRENPEAMPGEKIRTTAMLEFFLRIRRENLGP